MCDGVNSMKRKNEELPEVEFDPPRKRLRLAEFIKDDKPSTKSSDNNKVLIKVRKNKLLKAIKLHKRYKYSCEKHKVTYLVESKSFETTVPLTPVKRDNLVQSFQSLNMDLQQTSVLTSNQSDLPSVATDDINDDEDDDQVKSIDLVKNVNNNNNNNNLTTKPKLIKRATKRKIPEEYTYDDYESDDKSNDLEKKQKIKLKLQDLFMQNTRRFMNNVEDSDYDSDSQIRKQRRKPRYVKSLIVKKVLDGSKIIYSEDEDCCININKSLCDCEYHERLNEKSLNYDYEISSGYDSSDLSSDDYY